MQLAAATPVDSTYASAALHALVARAATENRFPPAALKAYRSRIETELSLLIRDTLGRERSAEVEQLATDALWTRGDRYDLHIVGYRSQNIGVPYSTLSLVRGWTVPTLYGDRLSLGAYFSSSRRNDTLVAVHPSPLIATASIDSRRRYSCDAPVGVANDFSRPYPCAPGHPNSTRLAAFDGEIDLDAERAQIVRMRGRMVVVGGRTATRTMMGQRFGVVAAAYVEFVNAEINGAYWLPAFQRTVSSKLPVFGQTRPYFVSCRRSVPSP
jgi:hypothetical protein